MPRVKCHLPLFLSTPSARRATGTADRADAQRHISIHALREEGALREPPPQAAPSQFLSTPSARRATRPVSPTRCWTSRFLSTPSARRATIFHFLFSQFRRFLSTPSARRATSFCMVYCHHRMYFYPRPPRGGRQQKQRQNLYFLINYTTFCTNLEEP